LAEVAVRLVRLKFAETFGGGKFKKLKKISPEVKKKSQNILILGSKFGGASS